MMRLRYARSACAIASVLVVASGALATTQVPAPGAPKPMTSLLALGGRKVPWEVTINPSANVVAIGSCQAVYIDLKDETGKDAPRNPSGWRVGMGDFDWTATGPGGTAAVGIYDGANNWRVCACQAAVAGTTINVMATYPAKSLPEKSKVPGLAFRSYIELPIGPARGTSNPPGCEKLTTTTVAISVPGGSLPVAPAGTPLPGSSGAVTSPTPAGSTTTTAPPPPVPISGGTTTGTKVAVTDPAAVPGAIVPAATAIVPINPSGFTAAQTGASEVRLSWYPVSGVSYYVLLGPGIPGGGIKLTGATTYTVTAVPAGANEWAVASYYEPGPVSTPAAAFPRVSLTLAGATTAAAPPATSAPAPTTPPATSTPAPGAKSGKYLVTMTALRAYFASFDDQLSRDGVGDEVYAAAAIRRYDRQTSQLTEFSTRRTITHGDVNKFESNRIQAGSRSASGGIRDGDMIGDGPLVANRRMPAQDAVFPWRLWQGTLTDGVDALLISPSIWEEDGGKNVYTVWEQRQPTMNLSLFLNQSVQDQISEKNFGSLVSGASAGVNGVVMDRTIRLAADVALLGFGMPFVSMLGASNDRPIGLINGGPDEATVPNYVVVLTREIIEAALAQPAVGIFPSPFANMAGPIGIGVLAPLPGLLMITFRDGRASGLAQLERPAWYQMFLQVERVP